MPSRGGQLHGFGEPAGSYGEPAYSRLGGGKSGSYADLLNNSMPSYGEQIHQNFGVRLRPSDPRVRPMMNPCDRGDVGLGGPLVERLVYLPPDPRDLDQGPPGPTRAPHWPRGTGNWVLGQQEHQQQSPHHQAFGPPHGHGGHLARLGLLQGPAWGPAKGIRRAQSFHTGGGRPQSMVDPPSLPLGQSRSRSLSASQTSLASGISRLSGKLTDLFSSRGSKARQFLSLERTKRRLPEPRQELPEVTNVRMGVGGGGPPFSQLVSRRQLPKSPAERRVLPDIVNHELWGRSNAGPRRMVGKRKGRGEFCREDQWFSKETLYKDHIAEVFEKWNNIEDEIWAKVIILERNRRVAKAYARAPILTVNGSEDGFDGFKIGVNGFENPLRDHKVKEFKTQIGAGCKMKMGQTGDILVKRVGRGNIFVKNILEETAVSNEILKLPNGMLELDRALKLFDMKKFQENLNRELKRPYPDRQKIETQCLSTLAFVKNEPELLDSPIWMIIVNVVALEMVRSRLPRSGGGRRLPQGCSSSDSDPYSPTASSRSSALYLPQHWASAGHQSEDYTEEELEARPSPRLVARPLGRDPYPAYSTIQPFPKWQNRGETGKRWH